MKKLDELKLKDCHWPEGDPKEPGFGFCGDKVERGPYCAKHAQEAYTGRVVPRPTEFCKTERI